MNDDFLTSFRRPPRPEFASSLYERINKPMQPQPKSWALRFALPTLSISVLAVLIVTVLFTPSVRGFAEGLWQQIGGYAFIQGQQPINQSKAPEPLGIVRTPDSAFPESLKLSGKAPSVKSPTEAGRLAGFTVLAPAYLPAGYTAVSDWFVTQQNGPRVTNGYRGTTNHFFVVTQWKSNGGDPEKYARDQVVDVTVRGRAGVWLPDTSNIKKALVWAENGITYSLITDSLQLDELLKIAQSLGK